MPQFEWDTEGILVLHISITSFSAAARHYRKDSDEDVDGVREEERAPAAEKTL